MTGSAAYRASAPPSGAEDGQRMAVRVLSHDPLMLRWPRPLANDSLAGPRFHTDARLCCSVDDFVSDAEIAEIRRLGEPLLQPSYIQRQDEDGLEEEDEAGERSSLRTSWS